MRPVTALDARPAQPATVPGYAEGFAAGYRAAEADVAEAWAVLARRIRSDASRVRGPIPEPRTRPQHDDSIWFTAAELASRAGAA